MCGIAGYVSESIFDGTKIIRTLNHRGPDNLGEYYDKIVKKNLFLGHSRLSIIDLSPSAHQPMKSLDGSIIVSFNGEIYNFLDLKDKYFKDHSFFSSSDTEVIIHMYQTMGIDFIKELNGDFAISIFDKEKSKLFLIRDRVGVKPLYYYYKNGTLLFASELKAILASGIKQKLCDQRIYEYFIFKYVPQEGTLFNNIHRLKPGHYLTYDFEAEKLDIEPYWVLKKKPEYSKLSYKEAKECFYELMKDATRIRLISDVPIGTFLSGGLDSSIIASFLKNNKEIVHYCASKNKKDLKKEGTSSDLMYAEMLAKDWGLNLTKQYIGVGEVTQEMIRKTLYYSDDLIADGSQIPSFLITQESAKTSKVILSGMGADEIFLGYPGHVITNFSLMLDKLPRSLATLLTNWFKKIPQGRGRFLTLKRHLHRIGKYYSYPTYKYGPLNIVGDFENSASIFKGDKEAIITIFNKYFPKDRDVWNSLFHFEIENFLVKNLHYLDKISMANAVESRVPFLDFRLVEFAYSLPKSYKLAGLIMTKKVMKDAFARILPRYVIKRKKAGFGMPLRSLFSSKEKIDKLIDWDFFNNYERFSVDNIEKIIESHINGKEDNSSIIYAIISFQEWYKMNIIT